MKPYPTEQPSKISRQQSPSGIAPTAIIVIILFLIFLIPACTGKCTKQLKYESGKKIVIPEYFQSSGVLISESLLEPKLKKHEFVASLLSKGKVYVYCQPVHSETNINKLIKLIHSSYGKQYYEHIAQNLIIFSNTEFNYKYNNAWNTSIWSRDWGPISFSYGGNLNYANFKYYLGRKHEDSAISALSKSNNSIISVTDLTIYNEGGNFMNDSHGNCYVTDKIITNNININFDPIIVGDAIKKQLVENIGCQSVTFVPSMPFEPTGHIDIWAKLISDKVMLVAELYDWQKESLSLKKYDELAMPISIDGFEKINSFLNKRADEFKNIGLTVYRIPMPVPYQSSTKTGRHRYIFRTYANSFLYNTGKNKTLYLPKYLNPYKDGPISNQNQYLDQHFLGAYEDILHDVLKKINNDFNMDIKPFWVLSDDLITGGGAVHCVVMQIPKLTQ